MGLYYKFKSEKEYKIIPLDDLFISVGDLKQKIYESRYSTKRGDLCMGKDYDLRVILAQTNEEYTHEGMLIRKNSSVLIRRIPGDRKRRPIDTTPIIVHVGKLENMQAETYEDTTSSDLRKSGVEGSSIFDMVDDQDFGGDVYAVPAALGLKKEEDGARRLEEGRRLEDLIKTPALGGFGGIYGSNRTPPEGYICHRCNVAGHFIRHCPFRRLRPPTGISGSSNEAKFDKLGSNQDEAKRLEEVSNKEEVVLNKEDEEAKRLEDFINTPALEGFEFGGMNRRRTPPAGYVCRRCNVAGHYIQHCPTNNDSNYNFSQSSSGTPPAGYVCRRCNVVGHYIQHCPTNNDPDYNFRSLRPPTSSSGSGNEAKFDKSVECQSSSRTPSSTVTNSQPSSRTPSSTVINIPPEFLCSLCEQVMREAVLCSKCCLKSFCNGCIKEQLMKKSNCLCGAANVFADSLIPNIAVRDAIKGLLESGLDNNSKRSSSSINSTSVVTTSIGRANARRKLDDAPQQQQMIKRARRYVSEEEA